MKLTQFLLSTHSLTMTAISEEDVKTKLILRAKAVKYLEYASNQYADLKKNTKIDTNLNANLMKLFNAYTGILEDIKNYTNPKWHLLYKCWNLYINLRFFRNYVRWLEFDGHRIPLG